MSYLYQYAGLIMRHKGRNLTTAQPAQTFDDVFNASHVLQSHNGAVQPGPMLQRTESISYTTRRKRDRAKANWCIHEKTSKHYAADTQSFVVGFSATQPGWTVEYRSIHGHAHNSSSTAVGAVKAAIGGAFGRAYLPTVAQNLFDQSFEDLKPDLTVISIPNFLLELRDIPKMWQLWKQKLSAVKNLAGLHLNYSFGWAPFLGDLERIGQLIISTRKKLQEWREALGQLKSSSRIVSTTNTSVSGSSTYPGSPHKVYWQGTLQRTVRATIAYRVEALEVLNGTDAILRAYLDALGIEANGRIIWDAIPFTFVVDWFFDVGGWLQRHSFDALELPVSIVDSYIQSKESLVVSSYWERGLDGSYTNKLVSPSIVTIEDCFYRMPILPSFLTLSAGGWKVPRPNQILKGFSLVLANT